ncbi:MAG: hypothetical protein ACKOWH_02600 [Rhodoluna sp.]
MDIKFVMALVAVSVFSLLLGVVFKSWRSRTATQEKLFGKPLSALDPFGSVIDKFDCFYVATSTQANLLERITAYGLGMRGRARVTVFTNGLLIIRNGQHSLALDSHQILSTSTVQTAIDRVVEKDGLIAIDWQPTASVPGFSLTTILRFADMHQQETFQRQVVNMRKVLA